MAADGGTLEGVIRPLVARLQASPEVDDAERQALGITVRDRVPTPVGRRFDRLETGPTRGDQGRYLAASATHHLVRRRADAHLHGQTGRRARRAGLGQGSVGVSPAKQRPRSNRSERVDVSGDRHAHAVCGRVRRCRREQGGPLHAALGIDARRARSVERDGQRDDRSVKRMAKAQARDYQLRRRVGMLAGLQDATTACPMPRQRRWTERTDSHSGILPGSIRVPNQGDQTCMVAGILQ